MTYDPSRPLVFMHIPKTAGIAVADALVQAADPPRCLFGFDLAFFGSFTDFDTVGSENRGFIHFGPATIPLGERLVRAHMSASTLRAAYGGGQFVTVLREPVCRLLSHFVFWRSFPPAALADWGGWAGRMALARGPLAAFLESPEIACQIDNVALRLLLWPHERIPDGGFIPPEEDAGLLDAARASLARFDHVGIAEAPDFWARLAAWLGRDFTPQRVNETPNLPPDARLDLAAELTSEAWARLEARTRLDRVLWTETLARADAAAIAEQARGRTIARLAALGA